MAKKNNSRFFDNELVTFSKEFDSVVSPENDTTIWDSTMVDKLYDRVLNHGLDLSKVQHPFFDKNINIRRGNTTFKYSEHELKEFKRCKKDIIYFANTYCKVMQETGINNIKLHDFQEDILNQHVNNKYSLVVGSRQIGKCSYPTVKVMTLNGLTPIYKIWFNSIKGNRSFIDYLKYVLYWLYDVLDN